MTAQTNTPNPTLPAVVAFYTREQVQEHLGIGKNKFWELIKSKQLGARRQGREVICLPSDIEAYLNSLPVVDGPMPRRSQSGEI